MIDGKVDTGQAYDAAIEQVGRQLLRLANQQHMSWGFPLIKASLLNRMLLTSYTKRFEIDDIGRSAEFGIWVLDAPGVEVNCISAVRNVGHNA